MFEIQHCSIGADAHRYNISPTVYTNNHGIFKNVLTAWKASKVKMFNLKKWFIIKPHA